MITSIVRRSTSLTPKRLLTLLCNQSLLATSTPLYHTHALDVERNSLSGLDEVVGKRTNYWCGTVMRGFHSNPGPLRTEFAAADFSFDEGKGSGGSEEGLEIAKLGISQEIVSSLAGRGITKLFPIQKAVLEPAMQGRDLYGRARTGTGKTLAFGIPIIDKIIQFNAKHGRGKYPLALVMAPTRELACQVEKEFHESAPSLDTICLYGGTPIMRQMRELDYGVDVVVGTPGRIIDLMKRGSLNLSEVQFVVLDEADQMLSVGFVDDVETIFQKLPQNRHSMLFSATLPSWIRNLVRNYLKDPLTIDLVGDSDQKLPDGITLYAISSEMYEKASILGPLITEHAKGGKSIIFTQTKRDADRLANAMARNFRCEALHGDISQTQRERTLSGFRNGNFNILVATDVAARGLDVPNVDLVIHYEIPNSSETFVHRSGRTGRAGKTGTAILVYTPDQTRQVRIFEREVGCRFTELSRIKVDGGGIDMFDDMRGGSQFGSFGGSRDRRFGDSGFGRSSGYGNSRASRFGGNRNPGFGRSESFGGQFSGQINGSRLFDNNRNQSGNSGRTGGFADSGRSDRSSAFGNFGSHRPSGFGDNTYASRTGGSSRDSRFNRSRSFRDSE